MVLSGNGWNAVVAGIAMKSFGDINEVFGDNNEIVRDKNDYLGEVNDNLHPLF